MRLKRPVAMQKENMGIAATIPLIMILVFASCGKPAVSPIMCSFSGWASWWNQARPPNCSVNLRTSAPGPTWPETSGRRGNKVTGLR